MSPAELDTKPGGYQQRSALSSLTFPNQAELWECVP